VKARTQEQIRACEVSAVIRMRTATRLAERRRVCHEAAVEVVEVVTSTLGEFKMSAASWWRVDGRGAPPERAVPDVPGSQQIKLLTGRGRFQRASLRGARREARTKKQVRSCEVSVVIRMRTATRLAERRSVCHEAAVEVVEVVTSTLGEFKIGSAGWPRDDCGRALPRGARRETRAKEQTRACEVSAGSAGDRGEGRSRVWQGGACHGPPLR